MRDDFPMRMTIVRDVGLDFQRPMAFHEVFGFHVDPMAQEMFRKPPENARLPATIDLTLVSPLQFGFSKSVSRQDFIQAAGEVGLELCHAHDAFDLRRQHLSQPRYEELIVATPPIWVPGFEGGLFFFGVGRQDTFVLRAVLT